MNVWKEYDLLSLGKCVKSMFNNTLSAQCDKQIREFIAAKVYKKTYGKPENLGLGQMEEVVDEVYQQSMERILKFKQKLKDFEPLQIATYFNRIVDNLIEDFRKASEKKPLSIDVTVKEEDDELELSEVISDNTALTSEEIFDKLVAQDIFEEFKSYVKGKELDLCDFIYYSGYSKDAQFREYPSADARYKAHQRVRERIRKFFEEVVNVSPSVVKIVVQKYKSEICDHIRFNK